MERVCIHDVERFETELSRGSVNEIDRLHYMRYKQVETPAQPDMTALDCGCGTGYGAYVLRRKGYAATAFDVCEKEIVRARQRWPGMEFLVAGLLDTPRPVNQLYDVITCFEVLEHIDDELPEMLVRLRSWMHTASWLYLSVPIEHPDKIWHKRRYSWLELASAIASFFHVDRYANSLGWRLSRK